MFGIRVSVAFSFLASAQSVFHGSPTYFLTTTLGTDPALPKVVSFVPILCFVLFYDGFDVSFYIFPTFVIYALSRDHGLSTGSEILHRSEIFVDYPGQGCYV